MNRRTVLSFLTAVLLLGGACGASQPVVLAQKVTTAAVSPPQALLPDPIRMPAGEAETARLNDVDIFYQVFGDGSPVLLLHGGLSNGDHWVNVIPELTAAGYQAIAMDSRGHGRSTFDQRPITYELMASDVLALMDHLGIEQADLVGWSDGGIIGLTLALSHPERLNRVVAYGANFDPTGVRLDIGQNAYFNAYIAQAAREYQELSPQPQRWDQFLANISHMWATEPNYTMDQLESIATPFLILDGEKEEAIDLNQTKLMWRLIPGAELALMPNTGHFALFEQPREFSQITLDFLLFD
jgi:pimeloyl-ACP methyl ester carboxylesterase